MNSDNNSLFAFNPVDYIDLDTALAEEELCSITHSPTKTNNYSDESYRISFKSIDDDELDSFRRSLVTPMSLNAKSQDPMYANVNFSRPNNTTTTNNAMYISRKRQSTISPAHVTTTKDPKRQSTTSPTNSYTESVTESVALFNNILNDEISVDLVASDLKDFMGSYNMDDLISRPGSRLPSTPSPQNIGRHNRDALVTRHYNNSPQVKMNNSRYSLPPLSSNEAKKDINDYNLISSSNFPTNMDNINKVTPPTTSSGLSKNDVPPPRKQSFDASVQTPSSFTALSYPALQLDTNNHHEEDPVVVPIRTNSKERVEKRLSLMKLKQPQQQQQAEQPTPMRRINSRLQPASADKRRWSSYIPGHSDNMTPQKEESKLSQLRNSRLPAKEEQVINNRDSNNDTNGVRSKPAVSEQSNRHSLVSSNRYVEKRASQRGSLLVDQPSKINHVESKPAPTMEQNTRNVTSSSRYVERRASNRGSLLINQNSKKNDTDSSKPTPVTEQSHRNVATSSRYLERRASNRGSSLVDQNSNNNNADSKPAPATYSNRYVERRASYREPNLTSRRASNSNLNAESNISASAQRSRDISSSSRYAERRASNSHINTESNSSAPAQRRDISSSSRYIERRASNSNVNNAESNSSAPTQRNRDIASSNRYVERRVSYREPITGYQPSTQNKRASYHGGYGNSPPTAPTITTYSEDFKQQPSVSTQRRARALSVPSSNQYSRNIEYSTSVEQPLKPSLMPVPVSRYRKHSNHSLSKYASVPENEVAPPHQPIAKEVRFSLNNNRRNGNDVNGGGNYNEEVQLVASRSTGGYSNSTTSSSHSGDLEYDPPTPPSSYIDHSITSRHEKRRSVPVFTNNDVPTQVPRLNRYSSYLARLKDTYEVPLEEDVPTTTQIPRRQRVVSEDNEHYKGQQRRQQQSSVTESARQVLAKVQQRRAKTAAILGGSYK